MTGVLDSSHAVPCVIGGFGVTLVAIVQSVALGVHLRHDVSRFKNTGNCRELRATSIEYDCKNTQASVTSIVTRFRSKAQPLKESGLQHMDIMAHMD
jgi:hypothetical protein